MRVLKISSVLLLFLVMLYAFTNGKPSKIFSNKQDPGMTVETFLQKVNNPQKIVLVYFSADWCVPCIKLKPIIEQIETEENAKVEILKIDVDKNPKVAQYFEINTLPLFMIYKNGKKVWEKNMYMEKSDLVSRIHFYAEEKK
ncbi:MAG TPA: thioredoxin family protein [Bacteroidia bacterium]|jgi:thioredoxin 1|nr:thioredoxin family protein [Bacteroidia bacterium]